MPQFRKKPVVIDAVKWTGENVQECLDFTNNLAFHPKELFPGTLTIPTLEGNMSAGIGDWIIKGVNGEFYPCKNDIFLKTYDSVDATEPKY